MIKIILHIYNKKYIIKNNDQSIFCMAESLGGRDVFLLKFKISLFFFRSNKFHTWRTWLAITHSLMLVTSLSSIMLQVCSVIIISPMIRGSRLTAYVVIVSKATSALVSSGIVHRHLEWKLTARKRRLLAPRRRFSRRETSFLGRKRRENGRWGRENHSERITNQRLIHDRDTFDTRQDPWLGSARFLRDRRDARGVWSKCHVFFLSLRRIGSWRKRLHGDAYVFPFSL